MLARVASSSRRGGTPISILTRAATPVPAGRLRDNPEIQRDLKERELIVLPKFAEQYGLELIERGLRGRGLTLDIDTRGNIRYSIVVAVPEHISLYFHGAGRDTNEGSPVFTGDVDFDDLISVWSPFPRRTLSYLTQDRRTLFIGAFMALQGAKLESRSGQSTFSGSVSLSACSLERVVGQCMRLAQELPGPPTVPRDPPGTTLRYFRRRHMRIFLGVAAGLLVLTGSLFTSWGQRELGWRIASLMFGGMTVVFGLGALHLWLGKYPRTALLRLLLFTLPISAAAVPFLFDFGAIAMGLYIFTIPMIVLAFAMNWRDSLSRMRSGPARPPSAYNEDEPELAADSEVHSGPSPLTTRGLPTSVESFETIQAGREDVVDDSLQGPPLVTTGEGADELQALQAEGQVHSSGAFTTAGRQSLRRLGGAFPYTFFLTSLVQAAVVAQAQAVHIRLGHDEVSLEFCPQLSPGLMEQLPDRLAGAQLGQGDALDPIVLACAAALFRSPDPKFCIDDVPDQPGAPVLQLTCIDPFKGFTIRMDASSLSVEPMPPGPSRFVFHARAKGGFRPRNKMISGGPRPPRSWHVFQCEFDYCPLPIFLDGQLVNGGFSGFSRPDCERGQMVKRLVLGPSPQVCGLVPPCLQDWSSLAYDLGMDRALEEIPNLEDNYQCLLMQLRYPGPGSPWNGLSDPLALTLASVAYSRTWLSRIWLRNKVERYPDLREGVMLREASCPGNGKRKSILYLPGESSGVPRGGPPCHAIFTLSLSSLAAHLASAGTIVPTNVHFLHRGRLLKEARLIDLGVPCRVLVGEAGLSTDIAEEKIVENERFHTVVRWLRQEARLMLEELLVRLCQPGQIRRWRLTGELYDAASAIAKNGCKGSRISVTR